ncbi:hypothetical protein GF312_11200 [Candidatus Poribacteria bacterium]|nr:hypothetical protein [Candidatus Poribacteria bacterium]
MIKFSVLGLIIILLIFIEENNIIGATIKVMRSEDAYTENLVKNGNFESLQDKQIQGWSAYKQGYETGPGQGRGGSVAAYCRNENAGDQKGISQTLELDQKRSLPLLVRGWSKAENVSGGRSSGYSLYVDITFQDGTNLWGQTGNFSTGTHDWEKQEVYIIQGKPIKRLNIYGLFRGHKGQVWFDDMEVFEMGGGESSLLDGVPVDLSEVSTGEDYVMGLFEMSTGDGMDISYDFGRGSLTSMKLDGKEIMYKDIPSGFLVRDVEANSDFYSFEGGICQELSLALDARPDENSTDNFVHMSGQITDITGRERSITLLFTIPVDATGWKWHDDVRSHRTIEPDREYINAVNIKTGSTGMMSLYPFGCITSEDNGLAIGLDMDMPAQYRIAYNSGTKQFFIAYDFGLAKETDKFPGSAPFRFVIYRTDPEWGFRSAAKNLYNIFPQHFVCRSKDQGIWMPFTDVSTVEGWEDFGFKYHEGINNVPFDDEAGILSFRYTEPSTWWMSMDPGIERTHENIMKQLNEYARSDDSRKRRSAEATIISGSFDEQGRYQYQVRNTPWSNGAVFSSNPNPYIPGNSEAYISWNDEIKRRLYGPDTKGEQDGEYLDSLEAYVTATENFRKEHFQYVNVPLTFSTNSKKPVIHKIFSVYEFSRCLARDIHRMNKLMFANSVPHRFAFLCPFFDVMGTEMNWVGADGSWNPASDSWMNLKRTMCYQKPYLFLMNTRYENFPPELVEKYFQRSLFYGMYPSMFSHNASQDPYWKAPEFYNRDRHLFKKYIPIIKRVAETGWEPLTYAKTDNEAVYVERFGPDEKGNVYFTVLNDSREEQKVIMEITSHVNIKDKLIDIVSQKEVKFSKNGKTVSLELDLSPEQVMVFNLSK